MVGVAKDLPALLIILSSYRCQECRYINKFISTLKYQLSLTKNQYFSTQFICLCGYLEGRSLLCK